MSDFWRCPSCQRAQEKSDQLKIMAEAKRTNAIVFANVSTRTYPCRFCGHTVDIGDVANGRLDCEVVMPAQPETKTGPVAAFFGCGLMGLVGYGILNVVVSLFVTGGLPWWSLFIGAGVGAAGGLIISLSGRK